MVNQRRLVKENKFYIFEVNCIVKKFQNYSMSIKTSKIIQFT